MTKFGLLFINNRHQEMYLPVFCGDRELAYSVFVDAMKSCTMTEKNERDRVARSFFQIADTLGKERRSTGPDDCPIFLSPEAVSEQCFGGVDSACKNAVYIFAADFEKGEIVTVK
jgi:hypothetical protein